MKKQKEYKGHKKRIDALSYSPFFLLFFLSFFLSFFLLGSHCENIDRQEAGSHCGDIGTQENEILGKLLVGTTDYAAGSLAVIDVENNHAVTKNVQSLPQDHRLRQIDDIPFVIGRYGVNSLIRLDKNACLVYEKSLRTMNEDPNPSDIAKLSEGIGVVSLYNTNRLVLFQLSSGSITESIDLPTENFQNPNTPLEASALHRYKNHIYIALQDTDNTKNTFTQPKKYYNAAGKILKLNASTRTFEGGVQSIIDGSHECRHPVSDFQEYKGNLDGDGIKDWLIISCVGDYIKNSSIQSGVWAYDLSKNGFKLLLAETENFGSLSDAFVVSDTFAFAVNSYPNYALLSFNPSTGESINTLYTPNARGGGLGEGTAYKNGKFYLSDRTLTKPGIRIFNVNTQTNRAMQETSSPIDTGLPPNSLLIMQ